MSSAGERKVGKGHVFWGKTPQKVLSSLGIPKDFCCGKPPPYQYIHRRAEDGSEIYFVSDKQNAWVEAICNFLVSKPRPEFWWPETGPMEKPAIYSQDNHITSLPVRLSEFGSVFVIFPPDSKQEADRIAKATLNGSKIASDYGSKIQISRKNGKFENLIFLSGQHTLQTANNKKFKIEIANLVNPLKITGPWDVPFASNWGAPPLVQFPELTSWSDHSDQGVRYFSGKATYYKKIQIPGEMCKNDRLLLLDLGEVEVIAIVKLNGKDLGILWKKPFRINITSAAHEGENSLELTVVNLWPNRLIGDANLLDNCNWSPSSGFGPNGESKKVTQSLKEYPQWHHDDKSSPTGRFTFSIIKFWSKVDILRKSGLPGPVILHSIAKVIS